MVDHRDLHSFPTRRSSDLAASIILIAARSLIDPVGLWSSSLAHSRTSAVGDNDGSPTRGVPPRDSTRLAKRAIDALRERSAARSEEHTSELQSRQYIVCRL